MATNNPANLTPADYLDAADEMTRTGRPYLAHLLAEEVAAGSSPTTAAGLRATYPDPTTARKD